MGVTYDLKLPDVTASLHYCIGKLGRNTTAVASVEGYSQGTLPKKNNSFLDI